MMIRGAIDKEGRWWVVLVPLLGAFAQGRTRQAACDAAAEIIRLRGSEYRQRGLETIEVVDAVDEVRVISSDARSLTAILLRYQRELHGFSLADVANRLGAKSRTSYAIYEQGKAEPTIGKLDQLLAAVAPELALGIVAHGGDVAEPRRPRRTRRLAG